MTRKCKTILVVDLEATCWGTGADGEPIVPEGMRREIIEVGLCKIDGKTLECTEKWSSDVRPVRSTISPYCSRLTGFTQERAEAAPPLADVAAVLAERFVTAEAVWMSWGEFDHQIMRRQCAEDGVRYPMPPLHLNLKLLAGLARADGKLLGLGTVGKTMQLTDDGTAHRAADDAWNTGAVAIELIKRLRAVGGLA